MERKELTGLRRIAPVVATGLWICSLPFHAEAADPPCDRYPAGKQPRCVAIWKELNEQDGPTIAQFGLDQQRRREQGQINAQQHLDENMAFIKQSTDKRLERLKKRMATE